MNILGLLFLLMIVGWIYDRARRNGKDSFLKIFIGIAAVLIGLVVSSFVFRYFFLEYLTGDNITWLPLVAIPTTAGVIWLIYFLLKKILTPKKEIENTPLDTDVRMK